MVRELSFTSAIHCYKHLLRLITPLCSASEVASKLTDWNRLNLPVEIVPATHKKAARPQRPATSRPGGGEGGYRDRPPRGDRDEYRRRDEGGEKEGAPSDFRPRYAGVGRGAPAS
jgi:hypothetical protein